MMAFENTQKVCVLTKSNSKLALAIPTYNRPELLEENLRSMLPELAKFGISVFISDDSTNSETAKVMADLIKEYPLLTYRHNNPRLGHDANFFSTLAMPDADYVWYLGDSIFIRPGGIERALKKLEAEPDFCFVNAYVKNFEDARIEPEHAHQFLLEYVWYLTLSGATIYGRKSRAITVSDDTKKCWSNFPQLGLILKYCSKYDACFEWVGEMCIGVNQKKKSYWGAQAFNVFAKDWSTLIRSFPSLFNELESKQVIRSHSSNTGIFGVLGLIRLRSANILNITSYEEFETDFEIASNHSVLAKFLCYLPCASCRFYLALIEPIRGIRSWVNRS